MSELIDGLFTVTLSNKSLAMFHGKLFQDSRRFMVLAAVVCILIDPHRYVQPIFVADLYGLPCSSVVKLILICKLSWLFATHLRP